MYTFFAGVSSSCGVIDSVFFSFTANCCDAELMRVRMLPIVIAYFEPNYKWTGFPLQDSSLTASHRMDLLLRFIDCGSGNSTNARAEQHNIIPLFHLEKNRIHLLLFNCEKSKEKFFIATIAIYFSST